MSIVGYDNAGEANQPSPIIWKDCPLSNLNDNGTGYFAHEDFLGPPTAIFFILTRIIFTHTLFHSKYLCCVTYFASFWISSLRC